MPATPRSGHGLPVEALRPLKRAAEELQRGVECPVCLQCFEDPRILPACAHTLCAGCADKVTDFGRVRCPVCRATSDLVHVDWRGRAEVGDLQRNHAVAALAETLQQHLRLLTVAEGVGRCLAGAQTPAEGGPEREQAEEEKADACEPAPPLFGGQLRAALRRIDEAETRAAAAAAAHADELRAVVALYERAWLRDVQERCWAAREEARRTAAAVEQAAGLDTLGLLASPPTPALLGLLEAAVGGTLPERLAPDEALAFPLERLDLASRPPRPAPAAEDVKLRLCEAGPLHVMFRAPFVSRGWPWRLAYQRRSLHEETPPLVCVSLYPDFQGIPPGFELFARVKVEIPVLGLTLECPFGGLAWDEDVIRRRVHRGWVTARETLPAPLDASVREGALPVRVSFAEVCLRRRDRPRTAAYPFLEPFLDMPFLNAHFPASSLA